MEIWRFTRKERKKLKEINVDFASVKEELFKLLGCRHKFASFDSLQDRWKLDPKKQ